MKAKAQILLLVPLLCIAMIKTSTVLGLYALWLNTTEIGSSHVQRPEERSEQKAFWADMNQWNPWNTIFP